MEQLEGSSCGLIPTNPRFLRGMWRSQGCGEPRAPLSQDFHQFPAPIAEENLGNGSGFSFVPAEGGSGAEGAAGTEAATDLLLLELLLGEKCQETHPKCSHLLGAVWNCCSWLKSGIYLGCPKGMMPRKGCSSASPAFQATLLLQT